MNCGYARCSTQVHDAFSMVLQDTWLFEGTIKENLIYNQKDITDQAVVEAAKAVQCLLYHDAQTVMVRFWMIQSGLSVESKAALDYCKELCSKCATPIFR